MADDEIVQNIRLTGAAEVIAGFAAIAEAGRKAFEGLAAGFTSTGFGDMASAISSLTQAFALGTAAVVAWDQSVASASNTVTNLAQEMGTTASELYALEAVLRNFGASTDNIGVAFRRLATRMESDWPQIQKAMQETAIRAEQDADRVVAAIDRIIEADQKLAENKLQQQKLAIEAAHQPEALRETAEKDAEEQIRADQNVENTRIEIDRARQDRALRAAQLQMDLNRNELEQEKNALEQSRLGEDFRMQHMQNRTAAAAAALSYEQAAYEYAVKWEGLQRDPELEREMAQRADALKVEEARNRLVEARTKLQREAADQAMKQQEVEQRGEELQMQRQMMQIQLARLQEDENRKRAEERERLREAEERQRDAAEKRSRDADMANIERQQLKLQQAQAATEASILEHEKTRALHEKEAADLKQKQDYENNIDRLKQYFDELRTTGGSSMQDLNLSVDNMAKGLIASLAASGKTVDDFKKSITNMGAAVPTEFATFKQLFDVFEQLNKIDPAKMEALATNLFGRGYAQAIVRAIAMGREAFEKEQARLEGLHLLPTKQMLADNDALYMSFAKLGSELSSIGTLFVSAFSPGLTVVLDQLRGMVEANAQAFAQLGQTIANAVMPAIAGLIEEISGKQITLPGVDQSQIDSWRQYFDRIKQYAESWKEELSATFHEVAAAGRVVYAMLDGLSQEIQKLSGYHITPETLGLAIFTAWATGALGAIGSVIMRIPAIGSAFLAVLSVVTTATGAIIEAIASIGIALLAAAAANPIAALFVAGAAAAAIAIYEIIQHWDEVKAAIASARDYIVQLAEAIASKIGGAWNVVVQNAKAAWGEIESIGMGVIHALESAIQKLWDLAKSALSALGSATGAANTGGVGSSLTPTYGGGYATGGMVSGHSGTDTNLIAATAGEFVMSKPAVDHWGGGFMESINSMSRSSIPRYAVGGPVGVAGSVGAVGGSGARANVPYGGSRALTLNILGNTFSGLWGPEHVMNSLETYASYLEGVSAGTPPSWMR